MNELQLTNKIQTMSSLEIAKLTGKEHSNVLRDIRNMMSSLDYSDLNSNTIQGVTVYLNEKGQTREINLDQSHSLTLVSGYEVKLRMAIIKRWQELETQAQQQLPGTYIEALQALIESEKAKESKQYCIYKHTSPTGKNYIGQTKNFKKRMYQYKNGTSGCRAIQSAMNKHGFDSFITEILEENLTVTEANEKEVFYIENYNSLQPNGYNLHTGGLNHTVSEETRKIIIKSLIGRKHTEETKRKMSKAHTGKIISNETKDRMRKMSNDNIRYGNKHHSYGKHLSDETKLKISLSKLGKHQTDEQKFNHSEFMKKNSKNAKKCICMETGKLWNSIKACAKDIKIPYTTLAKYLNNKDKNKTTIRNYGEVNTYHVEAWKIAYPSAILK